MTALEQSLKRFISQNIRTSGGFPTLQDVCTAFNFSHEQARKYMQSLAEDGYVQAQGQWFKFPEHAAAEVGEILTQDDVDELITGEAVNMVEPEKRKRGRPFGSVKKTVEDDPGKIYPAEDRLQISPKGYNFQVKIIQIAMGLVGMGAAIINIYYTSTWSLEFLPWPLAFLLSFIMVSFTVFAFEVIVIFASGAITDNKIIKSVVCMGFALLWTVAILFSTSNTIAGQVNKQFKNVENKVASVDHNSKEHWKILQEQKQESRQRLDDYRGQIKTYNQILSGMNTVESRKNNKGTWSDINYKLQRTQKDMTKISEELDEIRIQEKKVLDESKKKGTNVAGSDEKVLSFFEWLAIAIGISPDKIQLFLAVLPAVFCELIAPFGVAVALFLRNK